MAMSKAEMVRQMLSNSTNPNAINMPREEGRAQMKTLVDTNSALAAKRGYGTLRKMDNNLDEIRSIRKTYGKKLLSEK